MIEMTNAIAFIHVTDGVYGVHFPDFPGVIAAAHSFDTAIERAKEALALRIMNMVVDGEPMPTLRKIDELQRSTDWQSDGFAVPIPVTLPK